MSHGLTLEREKARVSIWKGRDVEKTVRRAISLLGGLEKIVAIHAF
jgi:hypothetical protein